METITSDVMYFYACKILSLLFLLCCVYLFVFCVLVCAGVCERVTVSEIDYRAFCFDVVSMFQGCTHRFKYVERNDYTNKWYPVGRCAVLNQDFRVDY